MIIEIYKKNIEKYGGIDNCIKEGYFIEWTPDRIKAAFNFGNGSIKDFQRYKKDNSKLCLFIEI